MVESSPDVNPVFLLQTLEQRALHAAASMPQSDGEMSRWRGIGFRLGDARLVAEMGEVHEVLHLPHVARVPGTKTWMLGLSSLRGALLPVADLSDFLGRGPLRINRDTRVLVIQDGGMLVGLVVEEVFGLQQFSSDSIVAKSARASDVDARLSPFVAGAVRDGDSSWLVFDVKQLLRASDFLQAAA